MASKKDMRRDDLIIPFNEPDKDKEDTTASSTIAQTMPMAAMFLRNKMIGWTAVVFAVQNWLSETQTQRASGNPAYFSVGMSIMSLLITYLPLFLPPQASRTGATQAQAAAPAPPPHA